MSERGYVVFDFYYNVVNKLGKVDSLAAAEELERQRYVQTEGRCDIRIYDLDNLDDMSELVDTIVRMVGY